MHQYQHGLHSGINLLDSLRLKVHAKHITVEYIHTHKDTSEAVLLTFSLSFISSSGIFLVTTFSGMVPRVLLRVRECPLVEVVPLVNVEFLSLLLSLTVSPRWLNHKSMTVPTATQSKSRKMTRLKVNIPGYI